MSTNNNTNNNTASNSTNTNTLIGYARVSTKGQSLEVQLEALSKAGVTKIFKEKLSGVDKERPELSNMLEFMRAGDTVVVTKIDRIARSIRHLLEIVDTLKDKQVALKILNNDIDTNTPNGKLMLGLLGVIAEFERELLLERQREGIDRAKLEGKFTGRQPTARAKADEVLKLASEGHTKKQIARKLKIGVASVYRILKTSKSVDNSK